MSIWGIVLGVLLAIVSVAIIVVIILQEGNQQGIGAVTGVADSISQRIRLVRLMRSSHAGQKFLLQYS